MTVRAAIGIITALASAATFATASLPNDAAQGRTPEQEALSAKGFYIDSYGAIRRLNEPDRLGCKGFELQAHRGYPTLPENSLSAVTTALSAKYNGVEVDARLLRDGTWVLNHDDNTRRTMVNTSGDTDLRSMGADDWLQATMRNRNGMLTQEKAATLNEVLVAAIPVTSSGQTFNFELKDTRMASCKDFGDLNNLISHRAYPRTISYSSMNGIQPLRCMREHNADAYLALIQGPSRDALEKWAGATHASELSKLNGNSRLRAAANLATDAFGDYRYPRWSSAAKLKELRQTLGGNVGLHVEITDLKADPGLAARARAAGVKLMTYTLTDNDSHIRDLLALKSKRALPDGAIVDSTPIKACKMLGLE